MPLLNDAKKPRKKAAAKTSRLKNRGASKAENDSQENGETSEQLSQPVQQAEIQQVSSTAELAQHAQHSEQNINAIAEQNVGMPVEAKLEVIATQNTVELQNSVLLDQANAIAVEAQSVSEYNSKSNGIDFTLSRSFFNFHPVSFIDDVFNSITDLLGDGIDDLERELLRSHNNRQRVKQVRVCVLCVLSVRRRWMRFQTKSKRI